MRRWARRALGVAAGAELFAVLAMPSARVYWVTMRETLRLAARVGIMDSGGGLGGQILGYNYLRKPAWAYDGGRVLAAAVGFGPALVLSLLVLQRVGVGRIGWGDSVCGKCGGRILGAREPRCPVCGVEF